MIEMTLGPIVSALAATILYSAAGYARNLKQTGEAFDPIKFLSTLLVGLLIGISAIAAGDPLAQEEFLTQLTAYAGVVVIVQRVLEMVIPESVLEELRGTNQNPH